MNESNSMLLTVNPLCKNAPAMFLPAPRNERGVAGKVGIWRVRIQCNCRRHVQRASMFLRPRRAIHSNGTIHPALKRVAHKRGQRLHVMQAHDGAASFPARCHDVVPASMKLFKCYGKWSSSGRGNRTLGSLSPPACTKSQIANSL